MQEFSIDTGSYTLTGLTFGQTNKDVVVAIHGWLDNCHSFVPMLKAQPLEQQWFCLDLPGHGKSSWRSRDAHYYFIDYVDDLYNFIAKLSVEKVHLVGHSMGAMVASVFAACFSDKVKTLTMIEGVGCVTTDSDDTAEQLKKAILNRQRVRSKPRRGYDSVEQIINARMATGDLNYENAALLMHRNVTAMDDKWALTTDPKLKNHSGFRFDQPQAIATIKQIKAPSLLILADNGYDFVKENSLLFGQYYPKLQQKTVSGGHHCHMQSSELCYEHIHAFFMQHNAC